MKVNLTYCALWNYEPQALSLTSKLLTEFKQDISGMNLVPAGGGVFEVEFDGELVYSKKKTGEFPKEEAILQMARKKIRKPA